MRDRLKDSGRLRHIKSSIENIHEFLSGKTADDFLMDKMLYYAIVKNLEIIGEAAYMLTNEFRETHSETKWKDIVNMRHILVHGYYQIDSRIVWHTILNDLPLLEHQINQYLMEIE